jgi:hypothetical protein
MLGGGLVGGEGLLACSVLIGRGGVSGGGVLFGSGDSSSNGSPRLELGVDGREPRE